MYELGIYGVFVGNSTHVILNEAVGHLLRTKLSTSNEGGVAAGFAVLSSPLLVGEEDKPLEKGLKEVGRLRPSVKRAKRKRHLLAACGIAVAHIIPIMLHRYLRKWAISRRGKLLH